MEKLLIPESPLQLKPVEFKERELYREPLLSVEKANTNPFIEANTKSVSLSHLKKDCTIPVFSKDNEITISHNQFIETSINAAIEALSVSLSQPEVRISHQIKGRTPDALHIPTNELLDHQRTIYYERMAWIARIPSITETIGGNELNLTIGGVRAYNQENLYSKKTHEKFKFFIGFQNMVCCNLCISTDGYRRELKTDNTDDLFAKVFETIQSYNSDQQLELMSNLNKHVISDRQFAQLIGRSKLYQYLPKAEKASLPNLLLTDSQFNTIAKDYYEDESFCRNESGDISMWKVYNLFTGANKSSYIDSFLDRNENAFAFAEGVSKAINGDSDYRWFLS
ncbi:hypothetical protein BST97_09700 [Nonlabens spongiae]|uniref:DUF3871 domain-containing protein n=1 Tax=Nonlabens spongiae TaxID=331648 RepID=A0A1W6MKY5_9FLAO|nr:DUF3871 family protein [Nonlabens spongiae]ARN78243.1 hypothetical protein BST97_09700 [Nonlabens spongiae]